MYWIGHGLMSFKLHRPANLAGGILWAAVFGAIGTIALLLICAAGEPRGANGLVFFPVISAALAMPFIIKYFRISILSPNPLRGLIGQIATDCPMQTPLIVTVSELVDAFDPDFPEIRAHQATIYPIGSAKYMPVYLDLSEFTSDDRINILLASTALPHGIFPAVQVRDAVYEDGGLSDNLPVYAAIKYANLAELSVIRLNPTGRRTLVRTWQCVDRLIRLREIPFDEARKRGRERFYARTNFPTGGPSRSLPPRVVPFRKPPWWPHVVTEIAPATSLGDFLSGTLNFSRDKARSLLAQGWCDGRASLSNPSKIPTNLPIEQILSNDIGAGRTMENHEVG
jgi:hypothetical protein